MRRLHDVLWALLVLVLAYCLRTIDRIGRTTMGTYILKLRRAREVEVVVEAANAHEAEAIVLKHVVPEDQWSTEPAYMATVVSAREVASLGRTPGVADPVRGDLDRRKTAR